jgi:AAA+ superfamily predicted ATPase
MLNTGCVAQVIELPIKHPELFESLGVAQPKGVLLYGPPGTGKTLLARAVAHHTDCTFIRVSGSELVQKYIGEGSRMVRELFVMARCASTPCISHRDMSKACAYPGDESRVEVSFSKGWCGMWQALGVVLRGHGCSASPLLEDFL